MTIDKVLHIDWTIDLEEKIKVTLFIESDSEQVINVKKIRSFEPDFFH